MSTRFDRTRLSEGILMSTAKARAVLTLLPDTCQITYVNNAGSINRQGVPAGASRANRQYNLSNNIPCRADVVRAFRPDALDYQATVVDELDLHLPHDMVVEEEDVVVLNGERYKIRKLDNDSVWEVTKVAKIMKVTTDLDVNP